MNVLISLPPQPPTPQLQQQKQLPPTLSTLPYDILRIVASHLPTASSVANFSAASKSLNTFITLEGWRVFIQTRFPSFHAEVIREHQLRKHQRNVQATDWRTWAEEQTLVSRNWQRRGFIAKVLEPEVFINVPTGPRAASGGWRGRRGGGGGSGPGITNTTKWAWTPGSSRGRQTMKYLPVLDVYESVCTDGGEVLGIGAGPDLVLRKRTGKGKGQWWGYENRDERAGRDDVTAIQLLRPSERGENTGGVEVAVVGRANGRLEMVALRTDSEPGSVGKSTVLRKYETNGLSVKSASLLHRGAAGGGVMSAILSNSNVALYPADAPELLSTGTGTAPEAAVEPISEIILADGEIPWKTAFLSPSLMALGTTSSEPLSVFSITDEGIRKKPLRTFSAMECTGIKTVGVYAVAPLSTSIGSSEGPGDVFLGGWYDGISRLHDLRSPDQFVATYTDPIDGQTPIYSLIPLGRERFVVGGGRHCILKIFDLRMSGVSHVYDYLQNPLNTSSISSTTLDSPGWATYLSPPARYRPHTNNSADWESPIYSLALTAGGKSLYAGSQGRVWEVDFLGRSLGVPMPTTVTAPPLSPPPAVMPRERMRNNVADVARGLKDLGTRLTMYEFGWTGTMYHQGPETDMGRPGINGGKMDGRWKATLATAE